MTQTAPALLVARLVATPVGTSFSGTVVARLVATPVGTAFSGTAVARVVAPAVPGTYAGGVAVARVVGPTPPTPPTPSTSHTAPYGDCAEYLLDYHVGGRVFRFSGRTQVVLDELGNEYAYTAGLDLAQTPAEVAQLGVTVRAGVDWARLVHTGHQLDRGRAVVRRWYPGQTLEQARVVLDGTCDRPEYGAIHEPITITVRDGDPASWSVVRPQSRVKDQVTWPVRGTPWNVQPNADGKHIPVVIGYPGHDPSAPHPWPAVPVLGVDYDDGPTAGNSRIAIADHRVTATSVQLWQELQSPSITASVPVTMRQDKLGHVAAVVEPGVAFIGPPNTVTLDAQWYVGMSPSTGGGIPWRGGTLRGFGDVVEHLLGAYSRTRVDVGALRSEVRLNNYKIDGYWNGTISPEQLINSLAQHLPVVQRRGPGGVWYQHWRYDATAADVVAYLDTTTNGITRVGRVQPARNEITNEYTIKYRRLRESNSYLESRTIGAVRGTQPAWSWPAGWPKQDARITPSTLCRTSQRLYTDGKPAPSREVAAGWIWDDATAAGILNQWALGRSFRRDVVQYECPAWCERLGLGAIVALTDPELYYGGVLFEVIARTDGPCTVLLTLRRVVPVGLDTRGGG